MITWECGGNFVKNREKIFFGQSKKPDWIFIENCLNQIPNHKTGGFELSRYIGEIETSYLTLIFDHGLYFPTLFFEADELDTKFLNAPKTSSNDFEILFGSFFPASETTKDINLIKRIYFEYFNTGDSSLLDTEL